jgi:putative tryptophan/tyrosine transport system substrate-binding protein
MKRRTLLAGMCAAAVSPTGALAQQPGRVYRVGFLVQRTPSFLYDMLVKELRELGWVLGRNLQLEQADFGGDMKRAEEFAQKLVEQRVDAIVVVGTHMALAARRATATIPIVMYLSGYPVQGGLVASHARPGGNITGLSTYGSETLFTKHMSIVRELLPSLRELGVIWDYLPPMFLEKETELGIGELTRAASMLKVKIHVWTNRNDADLASALSALRTSSVQAVFASGGPVHGTTANIERIREFTLSRKLPLICDIAGSVFLGAGLLSYSASFQEVAERCASFVDRILRGAKPGELPIELPTRFELVINLKTAKAIGLTIPPAMLIRADRVIE